MLSIELLLPRSAFSPREVARAGDVWRAFQELAVIGSIEAGWPPARYRAERCSFVVREMSVVHHGEAIYGDSLSGTTWIARTQRDMFFHRESRLQGPRGPLASASQSWVHVSDALVPTRAPRALLDAFSSEEHGPKVALPEAAPIAPVALPAFELDCWHTWMDPLAHVNHPAYVDFADEALARALAGVGIDPSRLVPVAELLHYRSGVVAGERLRIESTLVGSVGETAVLEQTMSVGARVCVRATLHRGLVSGSLVELLRG